MGRGIRRVQWFGVLLAALALLLFVSEQIRKQEKRAKREAALQFERWSRAVRESNPKVGADPCEVAGVVTAQTTGKPVMGAVVTLSPSRDIQEIRGFEDWAVVSGADGNWKLRISRFDSYAVTVTAAGYSPKVLVDFDACGLGGRSELPPLELQRGGGTLTGVVKTLSGRVLPGARITAQRRGPPEAHPTDERFVVLTNRDGVYRLQLDSGEYVLTATHPAQSPEARHAQVGRGRLSRANLTLLPAASARGRVLSRTSGLGVPDVLVHAKFGSFPSDSNPGVSRVQVTRTDANGAFAFDRIRPGFVLFEARGDGLVNADPTRRALEPGGTTHLDMWLEPGFAVSGTVVGFRSGRPMEGVQVRVRDLVFERTFSGRHLTDSEGRFEVSGLRPGRYGFLLQRGRGLVQKAALEVTLGGSDLPGQVLSFHPGVTVSGRIEPRLETWASLKREEDEIDSLTGMQVLTPVASVLAKNGTFEFVDVSPGKYSIEANAVDGRETSVHLTLTDRHRKDIELKLEPRASIAGTVVDTRGRPIADAHVDISLAPKTDERAGREGGRLPENHVFLRVATDHLGKFEARGLPPGDYALFLHDRLGHRPWANQRGKENEPVRVGLEGRQSHWRSLVAETCRGVIRGAVTGPEGLPAANTLIAAARVQESSEPRMKLTDQTEPSVTDSAGRFDLGQLCPGRYVISAASLSSVLRASQSYVELGADIVLRLRASSSLLHGSVSHRGVPIEEYLLSLTGPEHRQRLIRSSDGSYQLADLVAGEYELLVTAERGQARSLVFIEPGVPSYELNLPLVSFRTLRGRLIDGTSGAALPDTKVNLVFVPPGSGAGGTAESAISVRNRIHRTRTDSEGRFELTGLITGRAHLAFERERRPLTLDRTRIVTPADTLIGSGPWLDLEVAAEQDLDVGTISARGVRK